MQTVTLVGKSWLVLTPTEGANVQHANVIGFDTISARKDGLPAVMAVAKAHEV